MIAQTELFRFVEQGYVDPFSRDNNLFFIIDVSGSMANLATGTRTRLDITKSQMNKVLDALVRIRSERGINIKVGINAFSSSQNLLTGVENIDSSNVETLKAFVTGLTATGGTPYNVPMQRAVTHFSTPSPGRRRAAFFITDGAPEPISSVDSAVSIGFSMINGRGNFSKAVDNYVQIYGVAVDQFDTTHLARLDNTPRDGVQAVASDASDGLYNALLSSDYEEKIVYAFTNAPYPIEYGGETYQPAVIKHSEVESKEDLARANLTVTLDRDNPAGRRWLSDSVEYQVTATVWHVHENDDVVVAWKGRLTAVKPNGSEIRLNLDSIFTSLARAGLGARYQRMCRHSLYGRGCRVAAASYAVSGIPTAVTANTVTVPEAAGYPNGWFSGGFIETPDGGMRYISGHSGSTLTLFRPMESLNNLFLNQGYGLNYGMIYGGLKVKIYPGCDRSRTTCDTKFANLDNYGGFDWLPTKNPFSGSSIA